MMFRAFSVSGPGLDDGGGPGRLGLAALAAPAKASFTLDQALGYSFITGVVSAEHADRIAWTRMVRGVRNIWIADGPALQPRGRSRNSTADDGQELTWLTLSAGRQAAGLGARRRP